MFLHCCLSDISLFFFGLQLVAITLLISRNVRLSNMLLYILACVFFLRFLYFLRFVNIL